MAAQFQVPHRPVLQMNLLLVLCFDLGRLLLLLLLALLWLLLLLLLLLLALLALLLLWLLLLLWVLRLQLLLLALLLLWLLLLLLICAFHGHESDSTPRLSSSSLRCMQEQPQARDLDWHQRSWKEGGGVWHGCSELLRHAYNVGLHGGHEASRTFSACSAMQRNAAQRSAPL